MASTDRDREVLPHSIQSTTLMRIKSSRERGDRKDWSHISAPPCCIKVEVKPPPPPTGLGSAQPNINIRRIQNTKTQNITPDQRVFSEAASITSTVCPSSIIPHREVSQTTLPRILREKLCCVLIQIYFNTLRHNL